jgi:hypothetical protein
MANSIGGAAQSEFGTASLSPTAQTETRTGHASLHGGTVSANHAELLEKLRSGGLESRNELAAVLGLGENLLAGLIGLFSREADAQGPHKQYTFKLLSPATDTQQAMHFEGSQRSLLSGVDGAHVRQAFKRLGLPYRRDETLDQLRQRVQTPLPLAKLRKVIDATYGEDRTSLLADDHVLSAWFWSPQIDPARLSERIGFLAQQCRPIPSTPADADLGRLAPAYAAAAKAMELARQEDALPLEHSFLTDLQSLCTRGLMPDALAEVQEKQRVDIRTRAEKADAERQLKEIHDSCRDKLLLLEETPEEEPNEICARLISRVGKYPVKDDWTGKKHMNDGAHDFAVFRAQGVSTKLNTVAARYAGACKAMTAGPVLFGGIPALDAAHMEVDAAFRQLAKTVDEQIPNLLSSYKRTSNSMTTLNEWYVTGVHLLVSRATHYIFMRGNNVESVVRDADLRSFKGELGKQEADQLSANLHEWVPKSIYSELVPKLKARKDFTDTLCALRESGPESIFPDGDMKDDTRDTLISNGISTAMLHWKMEKLAASGEEWQFANAKPTDRAQSVKSVLGIELSGLLSDPDQRGFAGDLQWTLEYAEAQLVAMDCLTRREIRGSQSNRSEIEQARKNCESAAQSLRDLRDACAYLRDVAGDGAGSTYAGPVIAALERRILQLEVGISSCRAVEMSMPQTSIEAASVEVQVQTPAQEEQVARVVDDDGVRGTRAPSPSEAPAIEEQSPPPKVQPTHLANSEGALPPPDLLERLSGAQADVDAALKALERIDNSPSQELNRVYATLAVELLKAAVQAYGAIETEAASAASLPRNFPGPRARQKDASKAELRLAFARKLLDEQKNRLLWPTTKTAVQELAQTKGALTIVRPQAYVHRLRGFDEKTKLPQKMIRIEIGVNGDAKNGQVNHKQRVQTLYLHCHIDPSITIATPRDLKKIKAKHIREAHLKPAFFERMTNKTAPMTYTALGGRQRARVPYGEVPNGTALQWLNIASQQ